MQFLTLWTSLNYGLHCCDSIIQYRFNIDWPLVHEPANAPLMTDWRLRAGFFAPFLHEVWKWRRRKFLKDVSDSDGKGENYQRALTLLNEAVDILRSPGTTTDHLQQLPAHPSVGSVQVPATSERGYWGENYEKWRVFFRFTVGAHLPVKLVPVNPSSDFDQVLPQVDPKKVLNQRKPGLTRSSACVNQAIEWMTKCDN